MNSNSVPMVQQMVRMSFENLLETATGERADRCSAYEMERHLLKGVLRMGAGLMQLFLDYRAAQEQREEIVTAAGERLPYHSERERKYSSVFGHKEICCLDIMTAGTAHAQSVPVAGERNALRCERHWKMQHLPALGGVVIGSRRDQNSACR